MENLIGKRFSRLTVLRRGGNYICKSGQRVPQWICACQCGNETMVVAQYLRRGYTKSCGCLRKERVAKTGRRNKTHGESLKTVEYRTWLNMKQRCAHDKNYAGRGIRVCRRWMNSYKNFLADMGRKPKGDWSIERINNDGNYTPSNCKWATRHEQNKNTRRSKIGG